MDLKHIIFILVGMKTVDCQSLNQSKTLMSDMLTGYDKRQRPVLDQSTSVNVTVSFDLVSIQDFDEVDEKFSVVGLLYMSWKDESIVWDPASYGGIYSQMFKVNDVWYPILIQANPYGSIKDIGDDWMTVRIVYDGTAFFSPGAVFTSTCSVDVTYYPFDTQTCDLLFIPWGFSPEEMRIESERSDVLQSYFTANGEWDLDSTKAEHSTGGFESLTITFKIKRKPLFLVVNIILPIVFMAIINLLVFVLPVESGERVSYAITVLLSIAVFLTLVGENMPKTSEPMSILCYFLMLVLMISTLMCVITIFNLKVYHKTEKKIPGWCVSMTMLLTQKKGCCSRKGKVQDKATDNSVTVIGSEKDAMANFDVFDAFEKVNQGNNETEITWKDVSGAIDKIALITFTVTLAATVIVFLYTLISNKQP